MKLTSAWAAAAAWLFFAPLAALAADPQPSTRPAADTPTPAASPGRLDDSLSRAEAYVAKSDRYMHHSKLRRGMKGYGLTVMAGTKIVRFDAEIVSVMTKWGPHQDVILARLSGLGLEKSGVIAGMSGSPVYVKDPADGKDKLIGAVAFGWSAPKEPLCGIQPITQMLAVNGVLDKAQPATRPAGGDSWAGAPVGPRVAADKDFLRAALGARKLDYARLAMDDFSKPAESSTLRMAPLSTPLMVGGMGTVTLDKAAGLLKGSSIKLVQSGGVGTQDAKDAMSARFECGSAINIPLVSGDADWSAVGTVTEVIGDKVLAFGHAFFSEGESDFPMGPAYVHTIVPGVVESFKLASGLSVTGSLKRDESVGIVGVIGQAPVTTPMDVTVDWPDGRKQAFHYNVIRHRRFTPMLLALLTHDACMGWQGLPKEHTVQYSVKVDFGKLGCYYARNVSSMLQMDELVSDLVRPVWAMTRNPWCCPPEIRSIQVRVSVLKESRLARVVDMKLDGRIYKPGATLTGNLTVEPYRQGRKQIPLRFELPRDIAPGHYTLGACDATAATQELASEMPQRFDPRCVEDLFSAMQVAVDARNDCMYLRLPLHEGGLALRHRELPSMPAGKVRVLAEGDKPDMHAYTNSIVRKLSGDYVFSGCASADFEVSKKPAQTLTHQ